MKKKFCTDCRFYHPGTNPMQQYIPTSRPLYPSCTHPEGRQLTGDYFTLRDMRKPGGVCGEEGSLFKRAKPELKASHS